MRNSTKAILILFAIAGAVAVHHYIVSGGNWYDWADIENHETIIIIALSIAGTLLYLRSRRKKT